MSILIKGLEMPKNCDFCILKDLCDFSVPFTKRPSDCPLIEIPPHGRLIDADALDTGILQAGFSYALTRRKLSYTAGDVRQKIANAPTIIEAEVDE